MSAVVTLGGVPVLRGSARWDLAYGVQPVTSSYVVLRARLKDLPRPPKMLTLTIEHPDVDTLKVERLSLIAVSPTRHPDTVSVTVADQRFWLARRWHSAGYNVRRRSGVRRRLRQEGDRIEVALIADDVTFVPWSLVRGTRAWSPTDVLDDVLNSVWGRDTSRPTLAVSVPIESLEIDDPGDTALARVLGLFSLEIFLQVTGQLVVRHRDDGAESELNLGPALVGDPVGTDELSLAPSKVVVHITREPEVRIDLIEEHPSVARTGLSRTADNVAPTPDVITVLPGGRSVPTGVYANFTDLLRAWDADRQPGQVFPMTMSKLLETWFIPGVFERFVQGTSASPSPVLARRLGTIRAHFRASFQLHRSILDRISDWFPRRAGLLDSETLTFAPSLVYADWSVWYTLRGLAREGTNRTRMFDNFLGFAALLADARVAPVTLSAVDRELGILGLDWLADPWGDTMVVAPGTSSGGGKADPREARVGGDGITRGIATLDAGWQGSTVITVRPGAPNSLARFHTIEVDHEDAAKVLGYTVPKGAAPPFIVHVSPNLVTARYVWLDSEANLIENMLGGDLATASAVDAPEPVNADDLEGVAIAVGAKIYARTMPRRRGQHTQLMDPKLEPRGTIERVSHGIEADGTPTTVVHYSTLNPEYDITGLLPDGVRRRVLGLVDRRSGS